MSFLFAVILLCVKNFLGKKMKHKTIILKTAALVTAFVFALTTIAWSAPQTCLRPLALTEAKENTRIESGAGQIHETLDLGPSLELGSTPELPSLDIEPSKLLLSWEEALIKEFGRLPGFEKITKRYVGITLRVAKGLKNIGATILEFEKSIKVNIEGTDFEDANNGRHKRTGVEADIVIRHNDKIYLVDVKDLVSSPGIENALASYFKEKNKRGWKQSYRYEVVSKLLGYEIIIAFSVSHPKYPFDKIIPLTKPGKKGFHVFTTGPITGIGELTFPPTSPLEIADEIEPDRLIQSLEEELNLNQPLFDI